MSVFSNQVLYSLREQLDSRPCSCYIYWGGSRYQTKNWCPSIWLLTFAQVASPDNKASLPVIVSSCQSTWMSKQFALACYRLTGITNPSTFTSVLPTKKHARPQNIRHSTFCLRWRFDILTVGIDCADARRTPVRNGYLQQVR